MNKIKAFLMGFVLLIITFIIIVLVALLYRANDRMQIKSYIFQMQNMSKQRVGILQDINDISPEDLRNKLIKKYVSEYFKVIPGETNIERPILKKLGVTAYEKWKNTEAKTIAEMSGQNKFRMVHVYDDGIATINRPADYSYTDTFYKKIYYSVRYYTQTWNEPNKMGITPVLNQGTIYIEAMFKPLIEEEEVDVRKYLEQGGDPILLFDFTVTYVGSKEI